MPAFKSGRERDRFAQLYEQYLQLFLKVAKKIVGSAELSEDIVHDAMAEVLERREKFAFPDAVNFRNLCVKIIRNKCIDALRRNKPLDGAVPLDSEGAPEVPGGDEPLEMQIIRQEDYGRLRECLGALDPLNRQIIEMKYVHSMPLARICSELNMTLPQINGRLARARAHIRGMLKEEI